MFSYAPLKSKPELSSLYAEIPTIHHFLRFVGICRSSISTSSTSCIQTFISVSNNRGGGGGNEGKVTQRSRNKHLFNTVKFPDLFALSVSHNLHQDFTFNSFIKHISYSVSMSIQYTIHNKHSTLGFHKPPRYLKGTLL